jgi:chromosome partitioning protein
MKIKEAPAQGKTIFEYADGSNAARDYMRIVDRLVYGRETEGGESANDDVESSQSARVASA